MKNLKLNKYFIIISIFIIIIGGIIITIIITNNNHNLSKDSGLTISQKKQVLTFYYQNKNILNNIKNTLYDKEYSIKKIKEDGYIQLTDNSVIWLLDISPSIKQIFDDGSKYNIRAMHFGERNENNAFWLEAFFDENNVVIDLVYSETDLSLNSNMYSNIEDNWYLFVAGMT